eukprot:1191759-Prorocentrum_minimum.AAC.5
MPRAASQVSQSASQSVSPSVSQPFLRPRTLARSLLRALPCTSALTPRRPRRVRICRRALASRTPLTRTPLTRTRRCKLPLLSRLLGPSVDRRVAWRSATGRLHGHEAD